MDISLTIRALAATASLYWVGWIFYAKWLHPLAKFPGPALAVVSRLWVVLHVARGQAETEQRQLHEKYGPIVRIAPNELIINDPRAVRAIYGVNSHCIKTDFYLPFRSPFARHPDHLTATDEKYHASRRRITNNIYSMTSILQAEKYVDKCTDLFLHRLGEIADGKGTVDIFYWARMYAYDVVGEFYFGRMLGFLENRHDYLGYIKSIDTMIPIMAVAGVMPTYIRSVFMFGGLLFSRMREALSALSTLTQAADAAVEDRVQAQQRGDEQKPDVLSKILKVYHEQGEKLDFNLVDVKMEAFGAFFGGSDTTAIALSGTLYHVLKNPHIYHTLVEEIDRATINGDLSTPHLTYHEVAKLPYLNACIREGMRFHPSVGLSLPRQVPKEGKQVAGYWIPGDARIGINMAVMHLDSSVFGKDADRFNPERWLVSGADEMNQYILEFGAGSRTCMGKNIAMCELYKVIPELLRSFHLELEAPEQDLKNTSYWFYKPDEVILKVRRR
ncbi:cytochrome P450 monooxygenase [Aspergillus sclerotioniger CBS 115572]|uniref:Cytochrome P450 monooxygenase n=1 Tax=Aspergillus sclerotioniger CBS 115572 TaxID=1450535 RepID=A0A317UYQ3_9EURO|nr:cytochrome P450 monooxygenase [Aspergillus sclerotioniger CBS 115572]PWY66489.1 cytochrome P450 monooxygenase [Aspergillus sclerotioniger CBS 115572]